MVNITGMHCSTASWPTPPSFHPPCVEVRKAFLAISRKLKRRSKPGWALCNCVEMILSHYSIIPCFLQLMEMWVVQRPRDQGFSTKLKIRTRIFLTLQVVNYLFWWEHIVCRQLSTVSAADWRHYFIIFPSNVTLIAIRSVKKLLITVLNFASSYCEGILWLLCSP